MILFTFPSYVPPTRHDIVSLFPSFTSPSLTLSLSLSLVPLYPTCPLFSHRFARTDTCSRVYTRRARPTRRCFFHFFYSSEHYKFKQHTHTHTRAPVHERNFSGFARADKNDATRRRGLLYLLSNFFMGLQACQRRVGVTGGALTRARAH